MSNKKPHLDKYDYEKLLDDIKLVSRSIKIVRDEKDEEKRRFNSRLTEDLIVRLYRDIKEMHEIAPRNGRGYGGYLTDEGKEQE